MMDHRVPPDAAAISYFTLFALFPAILMLLAIFNDILKIFKVPRGSLEKIAAYFPFSKKFLAANMPLILDPSPVFAITCVVVVIWTSTWVFSIIENGLNRAWGVVGRRSFWESRFRSIIVVTTGGIILLSSAVLTALVNTTQKSRYYARDPIITWLGKSALLTAGLFLAILVYFCIYKLMPDRKVLWKEALSGAILAAILWEIDSYLFVWLVPYFDFERIYGQLGVVSVLMAWVYTSSLILLFGANFSSQLHKPLENNELKDESTGLPTIGSDIMPGKIRTFPAPR